MGVIAKSGETKEEAIKLYDQLKTFLTKGGFNLRKWISNAGRVLKSYPKNNLAASAMKASEEEPAALTLLGLQWKVKGYNPEVCRGTPAKMLSKIFQTVVLFFVPSKFDRLVVVSHFSIGMLILLTNIWANQRPLWQNEIAKEDKINVLELAKELKEIKDLELNWNYLIN